MAVSRLPRVEVRALTLDATALLPPARITYTKVFPNRTISPLHALPLWAETSRPGAYCHVCICHWILNGYPLIPEIPSRKADLDFRFIASDEAEVTHRNGKGMSHVTDGLVVAVCRPLNITSCQALKISKYLNHNGVEVGAVPSGTRRRSRSSFEEGMHVS